MKICLFGGSFDPVHSGHLAIAERALQQCALDRIVFLPCAQSPLKAHTPTASDRQRLDMLQLATRDYTWAGIDETDLRLPPPSWSWRIAEQFAQDHPEGQLYWLMGTDQWEQLEHWARWEYFCQLVTPIVHHRSQVPQEKPGIRALMIEGHHPASSSAIRQLLLSGQKVPADWLHPDVADYIAQNRLYVPRSTGAGS